MKVLSLSNVIAGMATVLSVRQTSALHNYNGIFHQALQRTWEQIQIEAERHRLKVDWTFAVDPVSGQRLCIDRALAEVEGQHMISMVGHEIRLAEWMWQEQGQSLFKLPGEPDMYERLTDGFMHHHGVLYREYRESQLPVGPT